MHKKRWMLIIRVVIVILIIHLALVLSKCKVTTQGYVTKEIPNNVSQESEEYVMNCTTKEYDWTYSWEEWYPEQNGVISVGFRLVNLEDRPGKFAVNFAFYDSKLFDYEKYKDLNYDLVREELPWSSASMWVDGYTVELNPGESVLITPSARKKDPTKEYWAYADLDVPSYDRCNKIYYTVNENRTVMKQERIIGNVTTTKSIWQILFGSKQKI